jgi:gamma-glutamylcyclotransferase (GGCT)/AIG2-like uncharacterized protein YtfP
MKIAVYGTLRLAQRNHYVLAAAKATFIETKVVVGIRVDVIESVSFPVASINDMHEAVVDIFEVPDENVWVLDQLEGYRPSDSSSMYLRVCLPNDSSTQIYVGNRNHWSGYKIVKSVVDWVKHNNEGETK